MYIRRNIVALVLREGERVRNQGAILIAYAYFFLGGGGDRSLGVIFNAYAYIYIYFFGGVGVRAWVLYSTHMRLFKLKNVQI